MVVSINSKTCKDGIIQFPTSIFSLKGKIKKRKNCGQIGIKNLLSDNDAIFFFLQQFFGGRSVLTEEKRIHEVPKTGQNVHGESSSFRIFLPVSS